MTHIRMLKAGMALTLLLMLSLVSLAQTITATGKVTDAKDGTPLPGVTVAEKGTSNATSTSADGTFSLAVKTGATLEITYVGYATAEVAAGQGLTITITASAKEVLNEVVVIGYGSARKKDLTGAVATVSQKDFQKGNITTPEQMIAGKVAGVTIVSNGGRPGAGSSIRIRGAASLGEGGVSLEPLIVIDGVPLDGGISGAANPLSFINPNDIESYTILKDASAAAIYGSRSNNGVIIITTKRGRSGKLKANFTSINSIARISNKIDLLSGDEVRAIVNASGNALQKTQLGSANTDWQDVIFQTAIGSDNNISLQGGIKKLPYRFSLGYLNQQGVLKTDKLQRTSASLALTPSLLDNHLKVDLNLRGALQETRFANEGAIGAAASFDPTQPVYTNDKRYGGFFEWRENDGSLVLNAGRNPLGLLEQTFDEQSPRRLIGNVQLDYKFHFLPELRLNTNLAYDISSSTGSRFVPDSAASDYFNGGSYSIGKQNRRNTVADVYINYAKELKSIKSRIDITTGYSYNNFWTKNFFYRGLNAKRDTIVGSKPPNFPFDIPEYTLLSYWGRLLYNFDSRYFLTASLRRDGSSKFSKENRWGWFPSVGLAWSIANEPWLRNSKTISELKLRAGYGLTGQQDGFNPYSYQANYGLGGQNSAYQFGNEFVTTFGPFGYNSRLKWEELVSYNLALDFGLLNNRISGSIDLYTRESQDLLSPVPQPTGTNFSAFVLANVGNLRNRGVELTLNLQPVKSKDVNWDLQLNGAYNENEITKILVNNDPNYKGLPVGGAAAVNGFTQLHALGNSRNTFYLYQQIYDNNGNPIEGLFEDRNRDGIINDNDRRLKHSAVGSWNFGVSTNLNYKKAFAGAVLRSSVGNYVYNNIFSNRGRVNQVLGNYTLGNASVNYLDTKFVGNVDIQPLSDYYLENASFIRMDNLFAGYNFGQVLKNRANLRLTASAQNLFVITKYKGLDPEHNGGIDNTLYPRPRTYALSINLDF